MPKHLNTADDFEMVAIERLKPHPNNVNEADTGAVIESIKAHGFYGALVVQRSTCHVVAGNHRLLAARTLGFSELPVTWITCDDEMAIRLMLTDNRSTRLGRDNPAALAELLTELAGTERGLVGLGFDGDDLDSLLNELAGMPQSGLLDDADPDAIPDDAPTRVKPGDLWQLGNHRLLCGDSTKAEDVARLMGGEKADMVFTDPPYGMNLDTDYTNLPKTNIKSKSYERVIGDNQDYNPALLLEIFDYVKEQFWWGGDYYYPHLPPHGSWIVWDKRNEASDGLAGNHFEVCWSRQHHRRAIKRHLWAGFTARDKGETRVHPTQKPVSLCADILQQYSDTGAIIADPYLGSGTTLIAAEQLGRKCYGIELEPKYCDVILSRYESCTGKTAELIENG